MEIKEILTAANGFCIAWEKEGIGFGELTFRSTKNGFVLDSEYMGEEFCNEVFAAFVKKYLPKEFLKENQVKEKNMETKVYVSKIDMPGCPEGTKFVKMSADYLPTNLPKDGEFYSPEGKFFPLFEEKDIISSNYFVLIGDNSNPTIDDVKYFTDKRNFELERFTVEVETDAPLEKIQERFERIVRLTKQLRLLEDALIIYRLTRKMELINKKYGI